MSSSLIMRGLTWLALAFFWASSSHAQDDDAGTRRFALIVGANDGGQERALLRYAQRDARTVARVLEQLGGVDPQDRVLLLEPSPEALLRAIDDIGGRAAGARATGQRAQLLFYYSGHSDERGLLLGEGRVHYRALRDALTGVAANVHVGVLDSCASGVLTRLKGGKRRAPFLMDSSTEVQGHAFLTSSSADEGAQESDRMGASFFTHYFVSGLRGAADYSGDGLVTLNEAYRFAFDETLASTAHTRAGPQHAAYDIQLVGTGDLVMTDVRQPAAALAIPKSLSGRLYVRDVRGNLVVELNKPAGRAVEIALDAETYQILLDRDGQLSKTRVTLAAHRTTLLDEGSFQLVAGETNRLRGNLPEPEGDYRTIAFGFGLFPPLSTNSRYRFSDQGRQARITNNISLHLAWGVSHRLQGAAFALAGNRSIEHVRGAQFAVGLNLTDRLQGLQYSSGANVARDVLGAQMGGLNLSRGHLQGMQYGLINLGDQVMGVQASLLNFGRGVNGLQLGLLNMSGKLSGVGMGLINVSAVEPSHGLQFGLANFSRARLHGLQFGLVNYAERASAQLGLLNVTREGGVHPLLYTSSSMPIQAGLRFDADYTFSTILGGLQPEPGRNTYSAGLSLGAKVPLPHGLWIEPELSHQTLLAKGRVGVDGGPSTLSRFALSLRWQAHRHLSVFGGPTFETIMHFNEANRDLRPGYIDDGWTLFENDDLQVLARVGFVLGVSL